MAASRTSSFALPAPGPRRQADATTRRAVPAPSPCEPPCDPAADACEAALARIQRLAWLLDDSIPLPGTRRRIGIDPLIGLVPGAGDAIAAALSLYLIAEARRAGLPRSVLRRMVANVVLETAVGAVPLVGDAFDAWFKANRRNVALAQRHLAARARDLRNQQERS